MNSAEIAARVAAYVNSFIGKEGFELLKTEYVSEDGIRYLRAYIDLTPEEREARRQQPEQEKTDSEAEEGEPEGGQTEKATERTGEPEENAGGDPGEDLPAEPGIGINDCALVSRRLSKWLDKEDFIPEEYTLEVCSRGYLDDSE